MRISNKPSQHHSFSQIWYNHHHPAPTFSILFHLNPRIILEESNIRIPQIRRVAKPLIPSRAALLHGRKSRRRNLLPQIVLSLQDLHREARGRVPGDVAVDEPRARVIGFESNDDEPARGEEDDVPTWGIVVVEVEVCGSGEVERKVRLLEEGEVVAVKMDLGEG